MACLAKAENRLETRLAEIFDLAAEIVKSHTENLETRRLVTDHFVTLRFARWWLACTTMDGDRRSAPLFKRQPLADRRHHPTTNCGELVTEAAVRLLFVCAQTQLGATAAWTTRAAHISKPACARCNACFEIACPACEVALLACIPMCACILSCGIPARACLDVVPIFGGSAESAWERNLGVPY